MTIRRHAGPTDGFQVLNQALSARGHNVHRLFALGGAPQVTSPLPIYQITLQEAAQPDPIGAAKQTGWYYPVIGGAAPGIAKIYFDGTTSKYEGITQGILPTRLIQAGYVADQQLGNVGEEYEPRMLLVPSLDIAALWLHAPFDHFISLLDGDPPGSAPLVVTTDIRSALNTALRARGNPAAAGGQRPTN